ncbi:hypothetical protein GCM10022267_45350 [Lentzea roselyniae]|uniref:Secreted protein n=1 Tax=Lentzea roselyniae TaxID=531940 RepID=A0ABP7BBJ7_9PSEU
MGPLPPWCCTVPCQEPTTGWALMNTWLSVTVSAPAAVVLASAAPLNARAVAEANTAKFLTIRGI